MRKVFSYLIITFLTIFTSISNVYALEANYREVYIGIGKQITLKVYNSASNEITWRSNNEGIATVENGIVTGKSLGHAYITITDGTYTISSKVYVVDDYVPISSLNLDSSNITLSIGSTHKVPVTISPANASNKLLQYRSSNDNIASVDSDGNITAISEGSAYISIIGEIHATSYKVKVVDKISLVDIETPSKLDLVEGETKQINVTYKPSNATNKNITWKSSNTAIVTVDGNGNVKAIASGNATVTATSSDGNHKAITTINVNAIDKTLKGISLNKEKITLEIGKEETLNVIYNPTNAENKTVKWTSSNNRIATVENGKITAIKAGKVTITATSLDNQHEATCEVTIPSPPIESIKFASENKTVYLGDKEILETISNPTDAIIEEPVWTSSDEKIVTVDEEGKITALKIGTAKISISDESGKITASIEINVIEKPEEDLLITIEGYDLKFNPNQKTYTLSIGNETELKINANVNKSGLIISGNRDLKNGSIITITVNNKSKSTYVINIKKGNDYSIYFLGIITILLIINLIRIIIATKHKKKKEL